MGHPGRSMTYAFVAQRSCVIALGLLAIVSVLPSRTLIAQSIEQSASRVFLELEVGVADAVDKQWANSRGVSLGLSLARRFPMDRKSSLFAGVELGQTLSPGTDAVCNGPGPGVCWPDFPEFGFVGVLLGAELRGGRLSGNLTVSPGYFISEKNDVSTNRYGVQAGIGGAFEIVRHVALTVKFRRAFPSSYEPYSGDFTNRTIGLRIQ